MHVSTAFPWSFYTWASLCGAPLVARGMRPYVSWGQRRLELLCGFSTLHVYFDVYNFICTVVVSSPHIYFA